VVALVRPQESLALEDLFEPAAARLARLAFSSRSMVLKTHKT